MFEDNEKYRSAGEGSSKRGISLDYSRTRHSREGGEGFFCRFTFGQFFALLVLEVFTIFFVFYLGARYGPKLLGFETKGPIVVGEKTGKVPTTADPEVQAMAQDIVAQAKSPELKERLAQMLNRSQKGSVPEGESQAAVPSKPSSFDTPPVAKETMQESPPVVASAPPESEQMPMRQAGTPAENQGGMVRIKSAENAKYALQVGSYQQVAEANAAVQKWKGKGYPAYLMIADIPDRGRWYRVRLGGFASRAEANKYKKQFEAQEAVETIVVMNEQ